MNNIDIVDMDILKDERNVKEMSKMKNYMMDIEEFCDGYFYGGDSEFTIDEVAADADKYFGQLWPVTMRWIISRSNLANEGTYNRWTSFYVLSRSSGR